MILGFTGRVTAMAFLGGGLLLWGELASRSDCLLSAVFLLVIALIITLSMAEVAFYRRRAFLARYLVADGHLHRLLGRRVLLLIWQGVKALVLGLVLLVGVITFEPREWAVLLVDIPVLAILTGGFYAALRGEVQEIYRAPMARHWALRVNSLLLWFGLMLLRFYSPHEDYVGLSWNEVAVTGAFSLNLGCDYIAIPARLSVVAEALAIWAAQNLLGGLTQPVQVALAWIVFLAAFGVSFLLAWAYSRALAGILSRPWKIGIREPGVPTADLSKNNSPENTSSKQDRWFWIGFVGIILAGLIIALFAAVRSGRNLIETGLEQSALPHAPTQVIRVIWYGGETLYLESASLDRTRREIASRVEQGRNSAVDRLEAELDEGLERIFSRISAGIPAFADWYYSLEGEYVRLFHAAVGDLAEHLEQKANELMFQPSDAAAEIDYLAEQLGATAVAQIRAVGLDLKNLLSQLIEPEPAAQDTVEVEIISEWRLGDQLGEHLEPYVSLGQTDIARQGVATTAGATASALTAKKLGGTVVAKAAGKVGAKTSLGTLAGLAGKLGLKSAAKAGGTLGGAGTGAATGAALCAGTGVGVSIAPGCALVGGMATGLAVWLLVDKAVIEADEYLNRDDLEADLRRTLEQQRGELRALLHDRYVAGLRSTFESLSHTVETKVRPQSVAPKKDFVPADRLLHFDGKEDSL